MGHQAGESTASRPGHRATRLYLFVALAVVVLVGVVSGSYALAQGFGPTTGTWTDLRASGQLPDTDMLMAYDVAAGKVVVFFDSRGSVRMKTWAYDVRDNRFLELKTSGAKPTSYQAAMAYDESSGKVIRLGNVGATGRSDTWAYDSRTNTWTDLQPAVSPPAISGASMAYNPALGKVVLFGGMRNGPGKLTWNLTWAYDAESNTWVDLRPTSSPTPRANAALVYDEPSGRMILFGGADLSPTVVSEPFATELDDTWAYDAKSNTWTELQPIGTPPGRWCATMAHDGASGKVILFGGTWSGGGFRDDTWAYDSRGNTWTELHTAGSPPACALALAFYDRISGTVILCGGFGNDVYGLAWSFSL